MGVLRTVRDEARPAQRPAASGSSACARRCLLDRPHRRPVARSARVLREVVVGLPPVPPLDALRSLGSAARGVERHRGRRRDGPDDRQHRHPGAPLRRRRKGGTPRQGLGRSRGGFSTKIHLRTNGAGLPVAVDIAPGQASDYTGALPLLDADGPEPKVLLADRGYDADAIRTEMEARGVTPIIPMRRSRKVQIPIDDYVYALRNRIERCFNKLKNWRRLATRYDKTAESYLGFVLIAAVRLWTRLFVNKT